jgi:hypothetical protein
MRPSTVCCAADRLCATDITAVAAKDVVFDALEFEEPNQVGQNRVHAISFRRNRRRRGCRYR